MWSQRNSEIQELEAPSASSSSECASVFWTCRQHGQCRLGLGHAEDESGGRAGADVSCALLSVGPPTPPAGSVHRQQPPVSVDPGGLRLRASPHWRYEAGAIPATRLPEPGIKSPPLDVFILTLGPSLCACQVGSRSRRWPGYAGATPWSPWGRSSSACATWTLTGGTSKKQTQELCEVHFLDLVKSVQSFYDIPHASVFVTFYTSTIFLKSSFKAQRGDSIVFL